MPHSPRAALCRALEWGPSGVRPALLAQPALNENQAGLCGWGQQSRTKAQMTAPCPGHCGPFMSGGRPLPWQAELLAGAGTMPPFRRPLSPTSAFDCKFMGIKWPAQLTGPTAQPLFPAPCALAPPQGWPREKGHPLHRPGPPPVAFLKQPFSHPELDSLQPKPFLAPAQGSEAGRTRVPAGRALACHSAPRCHPMWCLRKLRLGRGVRAHPPSRLSAQSLSTPPFWDSLSPGPQLLQLQKPRCSAPEFIQDPQG